MLHPDVQSAIREIAEDLFGTDHVYEVLQPGFTDTLPAVLVRGHQNDADTATATHRVQLEFYHHDMPSARLIARTLLAHLTAGPHATSHGRLDDIRIETELRDVPYPSPDTVEYTASVFVDTRPI